MPGQGQRFLRLRVDCLNFGQQAPPFPPQILMKQAQPSGFPPVRQGSVNFWDVHGHAYQEKARSPNAKIGIARYRLTPPAAD